MNIPPPPKGWVPQIREKSVMAPWGKSITIQIKDWSAWDEIAVLFRDVQNDQCQAVRLQATA